MSLLRLEEQPEPGRIVVSRRMTNTPRQEIYLAATDGQYRYVRRVEGKQEIEYLYDIVSDPAEQTNLLPNSAGSTQAEHLKAAVERYRERTEALLAGDEILSLPPLLGK